MNRLLAFFAAMLVVWPAMAQTSSTGIGNTIAKKNSAGYVIRLDSTKVAGTYVIGEAFPKAVVGFELGSAFVGTLYACETTTYSAGTCTAHTSPVSADFRNTSFDTTRGWYLLTVSTPESGSNVSYLRIYGGYEVGGGGGASCASGSTKGGGLNSDTGLYEWTCGNYAWSAEYGGIDANGVSDYNTPTTVGGNSWTLLCTGDGTASNGTTAEQSVCLDDGEQIKMYSMADIMLAHDFTRPGGTIYMPDGIYHDRYCGQSASAVANGCPVTRRSPTHQTRKISISHGIKLVMSGADSDGPHKNGRTGGWLIADHGADTDSDGVLSDNVTDPGGYAGYLPGRWAFKVGLAATDYDSRLCARTQTSTGCVTEIDSVREYDQEMLTAIGRTDSLILDPMVTPVGENPTACIDNRVANGVCSLDRRVRCTVNDGTDRDATGMTGGCSDIGLGSCVGVADALEALLEENADGDTYGSNASAGLYMVLQSYAQTGYGTDDVSNSSKQSSIAMVRNVSPTTCDGGNGRLVALGNMNDARSFYPDSAGGSENLSYDVSLYNPSQFPVYDDSVQYNKALFATPETMFNVGGGFYGVNIMPGSWRDRRSFTATADCRADLSSAQDAACDDIELVALGGGIMGGIYDSSVWYGGSSGGYAYSKIDGETSSFASEAKRNIFARGYGLQSDASGWTFEDNLWLDIDGSLGGGSWGGSVIFYLGFSPGFRMYRDRFYNVSGDSLFSFQKATGSIVRDIEVNSVTFRRGLVKVQGARRAIIDSITGHGYRGGPPIVIAPLSGVDVFDVSIRNIMIDNHGRWATDAVGPQAEPKAMVWATDIEGSGGLVTGPVVIENVSMSVHGDDSYCALFMDGGSGDESSAENGSGRTVDDWRHLLTFKNFNLERVSDGSVAGTFQATCLSDEAAVTSSGNGPEDTLNQFPTSEGGMPRWEQIYLNGVQYPDQPLNSVSTATAALTDCQNLVSGTTVLVHDAPTSAATCNDTSTANDGILDSAASDPNKFTARCKCNPNGDSGDGTWSAF